MSRDPKIGIGGAPTRETSLPAESAERKKYPVATGVLDYFPDALLAVARVSYEGNEQHNPGQPLNWARGKSMDQGDTDIRHFLARGTFDEDGQRHSAKHAWRALAALQIEIEEDQKRGIGLVIRPEDVVEGDNSVYETMMDPERKHCGDTDPKSHMVCTRQRGHSGRHVGHGGSLGDNRHKVLAVWEGK